MSKVKNQQGKEYFQSEESLNNEEFAHSLLVICFRI